MAGLKNNYALKLLERSGEDDILEKDLEQAVMLRDILGDPKIQVFITDSKISIFDKHQLFTDFFSGKISDHLMKFLNHMLQKNQESLIIPVLTEYIDWGNRRLGKVEAKIVSAKELTEKQVESIRDILSKQFDMDVEVKITVDPELIGGFYVLADGHIFDGTVKSDINNMKRMLKERKL